MFEDKSRDAIILILKNGAAYYLFKPLSAENVKDLWQYGKVDEKVKDIIDVNSAVPSSGVRISAIEDADANASPSSSASRLKKTKRKGSMAIKEDRYRERSNAPKKPRVVWTNELHSQFLMAIRQLGMHTPKKIFDIMNIPDLTRENVASHLQKYHLFLKKVDELLSVKGGSGNILTSKLAKGLSYEGLPPLSPPQLGDLGNAGHESPSSSTTNSNSELDQFEKELNQLFFFMDSISLLDEDWDIDLIEALFGTAPPKN
ncbi:hypothetical protein L6164_017313 [Bauhinia variegata]|uniref:Uncharacterized protein n=1 Tax=Bauhinia variegata TaxID=167791 RepID=A0ACB9N8P4_BAUVA|nr:hypothetical protein L6164_017313 [Bauhinia variegata]